MAMDTYNANDNTTEAHANSGSASPVLNGIAEAQPEQPALPSQLPQEPFDISNEEPWPSLQNSSDPEEEDVDQLESDDSLDDDPTASADHLLTQQTSSIEKPMSFLNGANSLVVNDASLSVSDTTMNEAHKNASASPSITMGNGSVLDDLEDVDSASPRASVAQPSTYPDFIPIDIDSSATDEDEPTSSSKVPPSASRQSSPILFYETTKRLSHPSTDMEAEILDANDLPTKRLRSDNAFSDSDVAKSSNSNGLTKRKRDKQPKTFIRQSTSLNSPRVLYRRELRSGYAYDIFMSYHASTSNSRNARDTHPEDPLRIFYIYRLMKEQHLIDQFQRIAIKKPDRNDILSVHPESHLSLLESTQDMPREDLLELESISDSIYVNNQTYEASLYAAGGVVQVCRAVVLDEVKNGFAIVRPPGHHAEPSTFMGFCFLNNVAIAASYCRRELGVKRIMIVDWDIHFGNGTYNIFERDADVLYLSLHRYEEEAEFYPNDTNGCIESIGEGGGTGRKVNIAWSRAGVRDADYLHAFHEVVMPIGYEFNPELVIVSAGFDAADGDEIGMCHVTPEGYSQMTHLLTGLANGRLVMALEGGYNLEATASSAVACMQVLAGEPPRPLKNTTPSISAVKTVADVKNVQKAFWSSLA